MRWPRTAVAARDFYEPLGTWLEATAYPTPDGLAVYVRDVTDEEIARHQVAESEKRLTRQGALLDVAHDAIVVRDLNHVVQYWNAAATRLYGYSNDEALGTSIKDLIYDKLDAFEIAAETTLRDGHWSGELHQRTKGRQAIITDSSWTLVVDAEGMPDSIFSVNTDITARKRQEAILLRSQRVASLGTFAGGIAHDLNNVLTPILTSAQLLAEEETHPERLQMLTTIEMSASRGAEMIRQVLSFARGAEGRRERIDMTALLDEFQGLCRTSLPKNITVRFTHDGHPLDTSGDATQLLQVLLNLTLNARDAMPDGGTLTISTRNVQLSATEAARHGLGAGAFVTIDVEDTGTGMSADTLSRIFEPFFTTKGQGSGTGLGLATSQAIVSGHGGFLQAYSEQGNGSRFQLLLPAATEATPNSDKSKFADDLVLPRGDGELVLIVDDEKEIRTATKTALELHGYTVSVSANGKDALEYIARESRPIALVLTDVMMPVMDGTALAEALADSNSGIPVIAMSGLTNNAARFDAPDRGVSAFLAKPFSTTDLLRAVHEVVNAQGGGHSG